MWQVWGIGEFAAEARGRLTCDLRSLIKERRRGKRCKDEWGDVEVLCHVPSYALYRFSAEIQDVWSRRRLSQPDLERY